jgi:hypothetical protein
MDDEIEKYVTELRHTVTIAWLNYEIWWVYKSSETRPEYVDTMNRYTLFFQTSLHAHFVALLVELYRLYETRKDTYNIPRFLALLKEHDAVPEAATNELEKLYAQAKPLWVKVNILRNKAFGHRSSAHTVSEAFKEAGVTPNELRDLAEITRKLLNTATQAWTRSTHAFNLSSREDALQLLGDLKAYHED